MAERLPAWSDLVSVEEACDRVSQCHEVVAILDDKQPLFTPREKSSPLASDEH